MGVPISTLVYRLRDEAGNVRTEAWILWELRENYSAPNQGVVVDLTPWFRRVDQVMVQPASGAGGIWVGKPNEADFPGHPGSGRLQVYGIGASGAFTEVQSGLPLSGTRFKLHVLGY